MQPLHLAHDESQPLALRYRHFFSRLERLDEIQTGIALGLCQDTQLLHFILREIKIPESVERICLSLDHPVEGPFLVITRDGHFVTCLGKGMHVDKPVVTRAQIDALLREKRLLRKGVELAKDRRGIRERPLKRLLRLVTHSADEVAREDFARVAAWAPILPELFTERFLSLTEELAQTRAQVTTLGGSEPGAEEMLRRYWNDMFAASHLLLLATMSSEGRAHLEKIAIEDPLRVARAWAVLTQTGAVSFIARAAWAAAQVGLPILDAIEQKMRDCFDFADIRCHAVASIAIGVRQRSSQGAASSTWSSLLERVPSLSASGASYVKLIAPLVEAVLAAPASTHETARLRIGHEALRGHAPADVAVLARVLPIVAPTDGISSPTRLKATLSLVAAAACDSAEHFYLPGALARPRRQPWTPQRTRELLEPGVPVKKVGLR